MSINIHSQQIALKRENVQEQQSIEREKEGERKNGLNMFNFHNCVGLLQERVSNIDFNKCLNDATSKCPSIENSGSSSSSSHTAFSFHISTSNKSEGDKVEISGMCRFDDAIYDI